MSYWQNSRESTSLGPMQAVTFDVTRTLIHAPRLVETYWQVLRRHGHVVCIEDVRRELPRVAQEFACRVDHRIDRFTAHPRGAQGYWRDYLVRLCQRLEVAEPSPFAAAELFDRLAREEPWEVYPDVRQTLEHLRIKGLRIGVVSNWDHRLPQLLERLRLAPWFDAITCSSACGVEKPHPGIFLHCLEALQVAPNRTLHVGDSSIDDIEGAEAAGLRTLRVDRTARGGQLLPLLEVLLHRPMLRLVTTDGENRRGGGVVHARG